MHAATASAITAVRRAVSFGLSGDAHAKESSAPGMTTSSPLAAPRSSRRRAWRAALGVSAAAALTLAGAAAPAAAEGPGDFRVVTPKMINCAPYVTPNTTEAVYDSEHGRRCMALLETAAGRALLNDNPHQKLTAEQKQLSGVRLARAVAAKLENNKIVRMAEKAKNEEKMKAAWARTAKEGKDLRSTQQSEQWVLRNGPWEGLSADHIYVSGPNQTTLNMSHHFRDGTFAQGAFTMNGRGRFIDDGYYIVDSSWDWGVRPAPDGLHLYVSLAIDWIHDDYTRRDLLTNTASVGLPGEVYRIDSRLEHFDHNVFGVGWTKKWEVYGSADTLNNFSIGGAYGKWGVGAAVNGNTWGTTLSGAYEMYTGFKLMPHWAPPINDDWGVGVYFSLDF